MSKSSRVYRWFRSIYGDVLERQRVSRARRRTQTQKAQDTFNGLESLESRVLLSATFELSSLLPANGGDGSQGAVVEGLDVNDFQGNAVTDIGDINGDGIDDFAIAATQANPGGGNNIGQVYVIFGKDTGSFSATLDLSTLDPDPLASNGGFAINGFGRLTNFGVSISSAGDVNDDGVDDLIIGASGQGPGAGSGFFIRGRAIVLFGIDYVDDNGVLTGNEFDVGFDSTDSDGVLELSVDGMTRRMNELDGTNGFEIFGGDPVTGAIEQDSMGHSVALAGDVNGDGVDDVIVGAPTVDDLTLGTDTGRAYVIFGRSAGFASTGGTLDLAGAANALDGTDGFIIEGEHGNDRLGSSVAAAGNIDHDSSGIGGSGISDIVVGAESGFNSGVITGKAYVIFGQNGGFAASIDSAALNGSNGFEINGAASQDMLNLSVGGAGDLNLDGVDDLVVSAPQVDIGGDANVGQTYVIYGKDTAVDGAFSASITPATDLNGANGVVINGIAADDRSGISVAPAGDFNGDGESDLIIGTQQSNGPTSPPGQAYIVFGGSTFDSDGDGLIDLDPLLFPDDAGLIINGIDAGETAGNAVSLAGDVNNDGLSDVLISAPFFDTTTETNVGRTYVLFGQVSNTEPQITALNSSNGTLESKGTVDAPVTIDGTFADVNSNDTHSVTVDWGDGSQSIFTEVDPEIDQLNDTFSINHTYANGGIFTITVTVADDNGAVSTAAQTAAVITGIGLNDGVLQVIGSDASEKVTIKPLGSDPDSLKVRIKDKVTGDVTEEIFLSADIASILVHTCDGDDAIMIAHTVNQDATLDGGDGNDLVFGGSGNDTLIGGLGNDKLLGRAGDDTILAGDGDDKAWGNHGDDMLYGGAGNDKLSGGVGLDYLDGGTGHDILWGRLNDDILHGGDGNDVLFGGLGDDELYGENGDDWLNGGAGDDIIVGGDGNDVIWGGLGDDMLFGGEGNDILFGGPGDDTIEGGNGDDLLFGGPGNDLLNGGDGLDLLFDNWGWVFE